MQGPVASRDRYVHGRRASAGDRASSCGCEQRNKAVEAHRGLHSPASEADPSGVYFAASLTNVCSDVDAKTCL